MPEDREETEEHHPVREVQEYTTVKVTHEETQREEEEDHKEEEIHDPPVLPLMREVRHTAEAEAEAEREIFHESPVRIS